MREYINQVVFESAGLGILVVDARHRIADANGVFEKMIGYRREELLGRQVSDISVPDVLQENLRMFDELKRGARSSYQLEKRYIAKSGQHIWAKVTGSLLPPDNGNLYVLGLVEDITEQKQAEQKRQSSEERFRHIVTSIYDWVWEIDSTGRFSYSSNKVEKLLGYSAEEILGRAPIELADEDHVAHLREIFTELSMQRQTFAQLQVLNRHKDGSKKLMEISGVPVHTADGEFAGFRGVAHDITQQAQLEQELAEASKLKTVGQLAGGIAHDFNNVLHVMLGNLKLLREDVTLPHDAIGMIDNSITAGERASRLTKQLLAFSRKQMLKPTVVNPAEALQKYLDVLERALPANIHVHSVVEGVTGYINVDEAALETAVLNLVLNSRDAMPDGGSVQLKVTKRGAADSSGCGVEVEISVQDDGCGIDSADLESVFEPFFTRKAIGEGSGLGLSMVYGFVKQSGGRVDVTSQVGQGTRVSMFFKEVGVLEAGAAVANAAEVSQ
jgi:PAS domain S-box-containing protein